MADKSGRAGKGAGAPVALIAKVTVDQILDQCLVAYGRGTGSLPSTGGAVASLRAHFKPRFKKALKKDPKRWLDKDASHALEKIFVLRCCEAIGRLAASKATARGALAISTADADSARAEVVLANPGPRPGDWCN